MSERVYIKENPYYDPKYVHYDYTGGKYYKQYIISTNAGAAIRLKEENMSTWLSRLAVWNP